MLLISSVLYVGDHCVAGGEAAAMKKCLSNLAFCFCVVLYSSNFLMIFFSGLCGCLHAFAVYFHSFADLLFSIKLQFDMKMIFQWVS